MAQGTDGQSDWFTQLMFPGATVSHLLIIPDYKDLSATLCIDCGK